MNVNCILKKEEKIMGQVQGNREELLATKGFYANLYNSQFEKISA